MARPRSIAGTGCPPPGLLNPYTSRVSALLPESHDYTDFLVGAKETRPRIWYVSPSRTHVSQNPDWLFELVSRGRQHEQQGLKTPHKWDEIEVCVIEDISPQLISRIGENIAINPAFFATHIANPPESELWQIHSPDSIEDATNAQHLTGVWEYLPLKEAPEAVKNAMTKYNRRLYGGEEWPISVNTTISYCRLARNVYLFLVDAPPPLPGILDPKYRDHIILRFAYARNIGGFLLPRVLEKPQALTVCEMLVTCFQRRWEFSCLFQPEHLTFPRVPLLYVLCYTGWYVRYKGLERQIRKVSFRETAQVRASTIGVGGRMKDSFELHKMREQLVILRDGINQTLACVAPATVAYFNKLGWHVYSPGVDDKTLFDGLRSILSRSDSLNTLLLESFQILMNTAAIQDARSSLELAKSSLFLSRLAAVYLPLSVALGIYGMNLAELNDSGQPVWVFVVTVVVIYALATCVGYFETLSQIFRDTAIRLGWKVD